MSNNSKISDFFKNQTIFLTGGTGLIGKLLVEKLVRISFDLKKVYILVRTKHGQNPQQRFEDFFDNSCFEKIKGENFKNKVSFITGDCNKPGLGLKSEDAHVLKNETTCIFHAAANVNFRQTIKEASYNVSSTKEMIKLAKEMANLKVFVYVSTAYSNCINNYIREEIYEPPIKAEAFLSLVKSCNERDLEKTLLPYLNKWPNNYAFSKCLSEDLIKDSITGISVAVVRPSIVTNTVRDPVPGWVDNYHGFVGLAAAGYRGVLQNLYLKKEKKLHLVPADFLCNCILAAAWDTANSKTIKVFNCVGKNIHLGKLVNMMNGFYWKIPTMKCLWYPKISIIQNQFWYNVNAFWLLMLALCIDFVFFCFKKPVWAAKMSKRITEQVNVLSYFATREWSFDEDRFTNLWNKLGDEDKNIFPFNSNTIDWDKYLFSCTLGIRVYLLKDPGTTFPKAKAKFISMFAVHYTIVALFYYFLYIVFKFLEFEADVKRLVRLAYTNASPTFQGTLAIETFVNGIRDGEIKKVLQLSRYQTSSEALIRALEVEAAYNSSRTWHKVRIAELDEEKNDKVEKLLEKLSQQMDGLSRGLENVASQKKSLECYRCCLVVFN
ncbi:hypothetical protein Zmor_028216 [Zophobas morio]|uniref:Fatty acyl-CoA reductase n=1 Tax=Zophobas morio TaxID=2755281 RepID=A0AA38M2W1_9CUCU|nr:hypothetical protein Zmor_028216 [Zophobas morio]